MSTPKEQAITAIENFLKGKGGPWDWGNFITSEIEDDPALDKIRKMCHDLPDTFPPPKDSGFYCGEEGIAFLEKLLGELRK